MAFCPISKKGTNSLNGTRYAGAFCDVYLFFVELSETRKKSLYVAEGGFDPPTSGLSAQHASSAPLCCLHVVVL